MHALPHILGISAFYHDSAAALIRGDEILAAAQQERFSRRKNDERFPCDAIAFCLQHGRLRPEELDAVVFYEKPIVKFVRLLETALAIAPLGWRPFLQAMPGWLSDKLDLRRTLRRELPGLSPRCELLFTPHHASHAASAFFPSPFRAAAILTVDGVGEWSTTMIGRGCEHEISLLEELRFPHSLGLLYSAFTAYCGFRINSGEYKLMGLAPYGESTYEPTIRDRLVDLKADGSFRLNLDHFDFLAGTTMTNERFHRAFGGPPRRPDEPITQRHCDVARSIQGVTEDIMLRLARHAREVTALDHLCLAGGVALNCVSNGRIQRERLFESLWIQPASSDAGAALGAALLAWHSYFRTKPEFSGGAERPPEGDRMHGALLGPAFPEHDIEHLLTQEGVPFERLAERELLERTVGLLQSGKVVGWFQGRMEFGPRALGNRSILADPRPPHMQALINSKIKHRESFRPFAPSVVRERQSEFFALDADSPYMLLVTTVRPGLRRAPPAGLSGLARVHYAHSTLPAVTHVDYSARVQSVSAETNPLFHALLTRFAAATGCPVLVNTSLNVRGEPIACSPADALRCFLRTNMDALALGPCLLQKPATPRPSAAGAARSSD